jgi:hypothetical protein
MAMEDDMERRQSAGVFVVTDSGAVGDGKTLNTAAIQTAIDMVAKRGGEVVVPAGIFLTGGLFLRSRVTLNLRQNAVLLGSPDIRHYPPVRWGHHMDRTPWHLVTADNVDHVVIRGEGTIDGNGPRFWKPTRKTDWHFWVQRWKRPSPMVEITRCRDVRIEGVTLQNSSGWTLHLHDTDRSIISGVTTRSTLFGPNTDGIDITGCHDMTISDCHIQAGDDAIALKTTVDSRTCERITVTNCVLETNCVAIRVGVESVRDFRHLVFSNCAVKNCSRGVEFYSMEGGVIEDVAVTDIVGSTDCGWPFNRPLTAFITPAPAEYGWGVRPEHSWYGRKGPKLKRGAIRRVSVRGFNMETDGRIMMAAAPGEEFRDVVMSDIRLQYGMLDDPYPRGPQIEGFGAFFPGMPELRGARAAICLQNMSDVTLERVRVEWPKYPVPKRWKMLKSPHRLAVNGVFYKGNDKAIRSGKLAPPFQVLWARNVMDSLLDVSGTAASVPGLSAEDVRDL